MHLRLQSCLKSKAPNDLNIWSFACRQFSAMLLSSGLVGVVLLTGVGCGESKPIASGSKDDTNPAAAAPVVATEKVDVDKQSEVANDSSSFEALNGKAPIDQAVKNPAKETVPPNVQAKAPPAVVKTVAKVQPTATQLEAWKTAKYESLQLLKLIDKKEAGYLSRIIAMPDGKSYVLAGTKLTLWSIEDDGAPVHTFIDLSREDDNSIKSIDVSLDGHLLIASDSHGTVSVFATAEKKQLASKQLSKANFADISLSPNSQDIATLGFGGEVSIWNASDLSSKKQFKVDTNGVKQIRYITNGVLAVAGESTSTWDATSGKKVAQLSPGGYHTSLALSADASTFSYADDAGIKFLKSSDSSAVGSFPGSFAMDERVVFAPEGSLIASVSGSMIRIWDRSSGSLDQVIDDAGRLLVDGSWSAKSNLLLSASVDGRVNIWGTTTNGEAVGLKPVQQGISPTTEPTPSELFLQVVDLRVFPKYPKSQVLLENETSLSYTTSGSKEDVETFCRYQMQERGWQEQADPNAMPGSMTFQKDKFVVVATVSDMTATEKNVSLTFLGNYDLRHAPRPSALKPELVYENENTVIYKSASSLPSIEAELLKSMHQEGWTAYARLNSSHNEQPDARNLEFVNGGITLNVMIGKYPTDPNKYSIQYSRMVSLHALPIPRDSGFVEFDASVSPFLVANTKMNFQDATAFYDQQMTANGWMVRPRDRHIDEKICWLSYTRGAEAVGIGLRHLEDGRTQVRVGQKLENTSWQLEKPTAASDSKPAAVGIEAADVPILSGANDVKYDVDDKSINFTIPTSSLAEITDEFGKKLIALGWAADDSGVRSDEYVLATFTKNKAEIQWRATMREKIASVSIQGDGLLWTKASPGSNSVISYETWQRRGKRLAGLEGLDEYLKEMNAIDAAKK